MKFVIVFWTQCNQASMASLLKPPLETVLTLLNSFPFSLYDWIDIVMGRFLGSVGNWTESCMFKVWFPPLSYILCLTVLDGIWIQSAKFVFSFCSLFYFLYVCITQWQLLSCSSNDHISQVHFHIWNYSCIYKNSDLISSPHIILLRK